MWNKKWFRIIAYVIGGIAALYGILFVVNVLCNVGLRKYIKTFTPASYENQLIPSHEGEYYTFYTDEALDVLQLTDIHIGGGFWTYKKDKQAIYEVLTILQNEKPDLVILTGDNTYCVPGFGFNGGFTFNNKMVAKTFLTMMEQSGVYYSSVFGNHDTEAFDYADRETIGALYESEEFPHCIFESNFSDQDAKLVPSVTNQIIEVRKSDGTLTKLLLLIDSNSYEKMDIITTALGKYDTIHQEQIDWAKEEIERISREEGLPSGEYVKSLAFMHIPPGEFRTALDDLITEEFDENGKIKGFTTNENPKDTEFIEGVWGEEKVCFGGLKNTSVAPNDQDLFFETLCEDMGSVEAIFCGHDHFNNAVVKYKGILLSYGFSIDHIAYGPQTVFSGSQRGATRIVISPDGKFSQEHLNAYENFSCDKNKFYPVDMDKVLYPEWTRTVEP